jgi:hypothetical protein
MKISNLDLPKSILDLPRSNFDLPNSNSGIPKSKSGIPKSKSLSQNPCSKEKMQKRPQSGEAGNGGE